MQTEVHGHALEVLRAAAMKDGNIDADSLFSDMADSGSDISLKAFQDFFAIRAPDVDAEQAALAFKSIAPNGLNRRAFMVALSSYFTCVKEISITESFEITTAKKMRKVEVGEMLEACSAIRTDTSLGLDRVQCRLLRDGVTGWATVKSKSGTLYLQ